MLFGSSARPIVLTLGAAAVLALGGATIPLTALASDSGSSEPAADPSAGASESPAPDPTPSDTPTSDPANPPPEVDPPPDPPSDGGGSTHTRAPSLTISMSLSSTTAAPGGTVTATVKVSARDATAHNAELRLSASGATVLSPGGIGDVGSESRSVASVVTIPGTHGPGTVKVTASISADHATTRRTSRTISVTAASAAAVAHLGAPGTNALPFTAPGSVPGIPATLPGAVQPQLPLIGQPPAVAPKLGQPGTPTALRAASSPLGMDDTMFRLVLTQVAWLSALLVFMSVLLIQIRLKRRRWLRLGARTR